MSEQQCIVHLFDSDEKLDELTSKRFTTINKYTQQWIELDKEPELSLATKNVVFCDKELEQVSPLFYHATCYRRYTDSNKLHKSKKSMESRMLADDEEQPVVKQLRVRSDEGRVMQSSSGSSQTVLPKICIICKKTDKWVRKKRDKLMNAETKSGGQLLSAAMKKNDEKILLHIRDKDCVAIEVCYHSKCYKDYVSCVNRDDYFTMPVRQSTPEYCSSTQPSWPMSPVQQNTSTLYHNTKPQSQITDATNVTEDSSFEQTLTPSSAPLLSRSVAENVDIYHAGIIVNRVMNEHKMPTIPWPPTAKDLDIHACQRAVPNELYNLVALIAGKTNDVPTTSNNVVHVSESDHLKILSICQDLVYLHFNGYVQTPKAVALGMALRHYTGSFHVANIIHKFGHCSSYDTVVRHETSLAEAHLQDDTKIPAGFAKGVPTIAVWDNIDWNEETLTGAGTTHHTNGILIQKGHSAAVPTTPNYKSTLSRRQRSLLPTETDLNPFHFHNRHGPINLDFPRESVAVSEDVISEARNMDTAFVLIKFISEDPAMMPGWTGFNRNVYSESLPVSAVHYLPVIEAAPTELSTVKEILDRSLQIADRLVLQHIVLVFDQAIYAKAQQIRWKDDHYSKRLIIRLGEFHTCMSFLSILGKRYGEAGLQDIIIESGVVAQGSIKGVLNGHNYNRSIRTHKLMFEALNRLRIQQFLEALSSENKDSYIELMHHLESSYPDSSALQDIIQSQQMKTFLEMYQTYIDQESEQNPTFALWSEYIEMVQLLLVFIRATRESNWMLHLHVIRLMLKWFFSYDRINYARYLPAYWMEMMQLETTNPDCHAQMLEKGQWTVQRTSHTFASIACDQAIEQTVNRDSKTSGGLTGITLNRGAVQRWILAQPDRSGISSQCETLAGMNDSIRSPKENDESHMRRNEEGVQSILTTIESMINPFNSDVDGLVSISSGLVASASVKENILTCKERGEQAAVNYMRHRLIENKEDMFKTIPSMKVKQFGYRLKKNKTNKIAVLKNDRTLFTRLLIITKHRHIDMRDVLKYSLGPVSYPLASTEGSIAKTNKAVLLSTLESLAPTTSSYLAEIVPQETALMIDGMALLQCLPANAIPSTFGALAKVVLKQITSLATQYHSRRVDFVTDTYPSESIKNCERERRAAAGHQVLELYGNEQKTPKQWKKFLNYGPNKEALAHFFFTSWQAMTIPSNLTVLISHGCDVHMFEFISSQPPIVSEIIDLKSDHEEADTKLLLHASHAARTYNDVVIRSPDTDVAVITLGLQNNIPCNLYFATGMKSKAHIISISNLAMLFGQPLCSALIGLHALSGCDSTSAFYGKGKKLMLHAVRESEMFLSTLAKLGNEFTLDESLLPNIEKLVCVLYGHKKLSSVNEARYLQFCTASSSEQSLPPTQDALTQHVKRATYQACIWKRALQPKLEAVSPVGCGWEKSDNGVLQFCWMTNPPAPSDVLQNTFCRCSKSKCQGGRCSCIANKLSCTDLCRCVDCENISRLDHQDSEDDNYCSDSDN